jgi:hypothetical protein
MPCTVYCQYTSSDVSYVQHLQHVAFSREARGKIKTACLWSGLIRPAPAVCSIQQHKLIHELQGAHALDPLAATSHTSSTCNMWHTAGQHRVVITWCTKALHATIPLLACLWDMHESPILCE